MSLGLGRKLKLVSAGKSRIWDVGGLAQLQIGRGRGQMRNTSLALSSMNEAVIWETKLILMTEGDE